MDKDLLRLVIIAVGAVVILGMILWGVLSSRSKRKKINFYDKKDPLENIDPKLVMHTEDDDFDIVPISTRDNEAYQVTTRANPEYKAAEQNDDALDLEMDLDLTLDQGTAASDETSGEKKLLPALIQLSIVAQTEQGFTGPQILETCEQLGLVYGSVQVFERLDILGRVDYAVASMIEPGTFPADNWDAYRCPGITFFIQPREVDDAAVVFKEMINTIGQLSALLKGDVLDQQQQLLTEETLHEIEATLV